MLGGTGQRHLGEAAADGRGTAGHETSDQHGAASLARVEGGGRAQGRRPLQ